MSKIVRKIMMILSSIFLLLIIVCVIYNMINGFKPNNVEVYIFEIVLGLVVGIIILSKGYFEKDKFQNNELNIVLGMFTILFYIISIFLFIYETFFVLESKVGVIGGIVAAMVLFNAMYNVTKVKKNIIKTQ